MIRPRKIEKTEKLGFGTILRPNFSKIEKFIENYIYHKRFHFIRPQKADFRLRKWFSHNFPIL